MPDPGEVLKSALSLKLEDRATLAERLLASLDELDEEEAERVWAEEAQRRWLAQSEALRHSEAESPMKRRPSSCARQRK